MSASGVPINDIAAKLPFLLFIATVVMLTVTKNIFVTVTENFSTTYTTLLKPYLL